jgi:hypothetical protein
MNVLSTELAEQVVHLVELNEIDVLEPLFSSLETSCPLLKEVFASRDLPRSE